MDRNYIADHINRIETRHKDNPKLQADSMWRIASNADLFPLNSDILTDEQINQVHRFIDDFKRGG